MGRFRYCRDIVKEVKALDPNSRITERALREWITNGILPALSVGNRKLVDLDVVLDILKEPNPTPPTKDPKPKIRKIG